LLAAVGGKELRIEIGGETSMYRDIRNLRRRDFAVVGTAAITVIFLILVWLIRSAVESLILVAATLLTYLASYGATYLIFNAWFGLEGLGYQVRFMLFVIILSLGQDYNIYVVTRIREEMARFSPREAVALAVRRTGRVVSSCGIIMAATFFSMISGALMLMKELAVAFAPGILIDTFVVRPLLVPAMIYLRARFREPERAVIREPVPEAAGTG